MDLLTSFFDCVPDDKCCFSTGCQDKYAVITRRPSYLRRFRTLAVSFDLLSGKALWRDELIMPLCGDTDAVLGFDKLKECDHLAWQNIDFLP
jgi:hypothetical protein